MELRDYLEIGANKAGSLTALGKLLDMSQPRMSHCKAHKEKLPIEAAVKLADYIGADLRGLIAANELVTERKEEKRTFWTPFAQHARFVGFALTLTTANVLNLLTPTPAQAAPMLEVRTGTLCIMLSRLLKRRSEQGQLNRLMKMFLESLEAMLKPRIPQMQTI